MKEITKTLVMGLTIACLFIATRSRAQESELVERSEPAKAPKLTLQSVEAQVTALQGQVASLQSALTTLQSQVTNLQSALGKVQASNVLALDPYVFVVLKTVNGLAGPHLFFHGANVHIESGSGTTTENINGLGNLVVGYDDDTICGKGTTPDANRTGSHNLIIGDCHQFTDAGGFVAGFQNTISGTSASVSGGVGNIASGLSSSVSGGAKNTASGLESSVGGGIGQNATNPDQNIN